MIYCLSITNKFAVTHKQKISKYLWNKKQRCKDANSNARGYNVNKLIGFGGTLLSYEYNILKIEAAAHSSYIYRYIERYTKLLNIPVVVLKSITIDEA